MLTCSQCASIFKRKGVTIVTVGIGKNVQWNDLKRIAGTKGKVIKIDNFQTVMTRLTQILNTACGEWHYLFQSQ